MLSISNSLPSSLRTITLTLLTSIEPHLHIHILLAYVTF
uniref:Protein traI n=1 Tax=Siphoviridae sp. ctxvK3 TaxID=2827975 RepID=A0A8S5SGD9_9CAUD|nr:MAG TPA: Protein traI [Siphoviridae sp. ctxvK3]